MIREIATDVMLGLAIVVVACSALGLLVMKDAARLHFVTPVSVVAPFLITLAILVPRSLRAMIIGR